MPAPESATGPSAEILLLRHAATSWNRQQRRIGWSDQPLDADGRRAAAEWVPGDGRDIAAVACSDLVRARDTARLIARRLRLGEVLELPGLREQDQGAWTGLTKAEVKERWPERLRERPRRPVDGETAEEVLGRATRALRELAAQHPCGAAIAVTHSHVIRLLEAALAVESPPVPHLEGRWLTVSGAQLEGAADGIRAGAITGGRELPGREHDLVGAEASR